jgi:hypothetical protein
MKRTKRSLKTRLVSILTSLSLALSLGYSTIPQEAHAMGILDGLVSGITAVGDLALKGVSTVAGGLWGGTKLVAGGLWKGISKVGQLGFGKDGYIIGGNGILWDTERENKLVTPAPFYGSEWGDVGHAWGVGHDPVFGIYDGSRSSEGRMDDSPVVAESATNTNPAY